MDVEHADAARSYYRAIDRGAYDRLASLLAPEFIHERPDQTLDGRERFVSFMRDDRSLTDTKHAVDAVYGSEDADEVAVRGRLLQGDETLFGFVDAFSFDGERIERIRTYTD